MSGFEVDLIRDLRAAGCEVVRHGKGSHTVWENEAGHRFPVPHRVKSRHIKTKILKQALEGTCLRVK